MDVAFAVRTSTLRKIAPGTSHLMRETQVKVTTKARKVREKAKVRKVKRVTKTDVPDTVKLKQYRLAILGLHLPLRLSHLCVALLCLHSRCLNMTCLLLPQFPDRTVCLARGEVTVRTLCLAENSTALRYLHRLALSTSLALRTLRQRSPPRTTKKQVPGTLYEELKFGE